MKKSKYNICFERGGRKYVYNQLASSLLELDEALYKVLESGDVDSIPSEIMEELSNSSIVIDDNLEESRVVLMRIMRQKFDQSSVRVTIMPTLNCNFRCWYCYENHHESFMTDKNIQSVLSFCKILISSGVRHFHLDWFGGEPLLYFSEIMYPMSKKIMDFCHNNNVGFTHSITTNGYLIDDNVVSEMSEIQLNRFQITLDGGSRYHNRTRFTENDKNTFPTIVTNIVKLCRGIKNMDMTVRINYTPYNIDSIDEIVDQFPQDIRRNISICPQLVWQFKDSFNTTTDKLRKLLDKFKKYGYRPHINSLCGQSCYAENCNQFVVNYDLQVFKCTARDFSQKHCVGNIGDGKFIPNAHYFDYAISHDIENTKCCDCKLLPTCLGRCVQKRVEEQKMNCDKEKLVQSLINDICLYMNIPS